MRLLAIDTSTEACSAAVLFEGGVCERFELAPQRHTELILPMCTAVLAEAGLELADLGGLAFGRGPGAFTGLRVACGVIQGIALATSLRVVPVSSLAALALGAMRELGARRVYAALDARMGEVYCAAYEADAAARPREVAAERVCTPQAAPLVAGTGWVGVGTGFAAHGGQLRERLAAHLGAALPHRHPRARDVAELGAALFARGLAVEAQEALPTYLRDQVAEPPQ